MLLPFYSQDKYLNVFKKREILNLLKKVKDFDKFFWLCLLSPLLINFFYCMMYKGSNDISSIFTIFLQGFFGKLETDKFVWIVFFINCFAWFFLFLIIFKRTALAIDIYKKFKFFETNNPNFFNEYKHLIFLTTFSPFHSSKLYIFIFNDANHQIPHEYHL